MEESVVHNCNRPYRLWITTALAFVALASYADSSSAQEGTAYRLGPDDVISVSFWQVAGLDQPAVRVRKDGMVALPVIGDTRLSGLTLEEAAAEIVSRISRYERDITHALVQVVQFNALKVIVTGSVRVPGTYPYERIPDLWSVIRDAGGPLQTADLTKVTVVSPSGQKQIVNLGAILAGQKADTLPPLTPGTVVEVPAETVPVETYGHSGDDREAIVFVTGAVVNPGAVPIEGDMTLYDAIARAGGFSASGDPGNVSVISRGSLGPVSSLVDLRPQTADQTARNYRVQYEDMVIVGERGGGASAVLRDVAAVAAVALSLVILLDYANGRDTGR